MKITYEIDGQTYTETVPASTVRRIVTAHYRHAKKWELARPAKRKFTGEQMYKMRDAVVMSKSRATWDRIKNDDVILAKVWDKLTKLM